jgi:hypothetical protein
MILIERDYLLLYTILEELEMLFSQTASKIAGLFAKHLNFKLHLLALLRGRLRRPEECQDQ